MKMGALVYWKAIHIVVLFLQGYTGNDLYSYKNPIRSFWHCYIRYLVELLGLADRLRYGYVVDFLDFRIWPVFNIADCFVVIGVLILAYLIMFHPEFQSLSDKTGGKS